MTLRAGSKTQLLISLDKNVIWTNKLWTAVYFKRNIKGPKNSQLNFPTKSHRRFCFNIAASCDSHVKGISELPPPVTHCWGQRAWYVKVVTPRSRRVYPPTTTPQCQLHSLDLITKLNSLGHLGIQTYNIYFYFIKEVALSFSDNKLQTSRQLYVLHVHLLIFQFLCKGKGRFLKWKIKYCQPV